MSFSWSGIKLVVDLEMDTTPETEENDEIVDEIVGESSGAGSEAGHAVQQNKDREDGSTTKFGSTSESNSLLHEALANHLNEEKYSDKQQSIKAEEECRSETPDKCPWPEWGEPLPPEDVDDVLDVNSAREIEKPHISEKMVTFSDIVTFVEPTSLQEERGTESFSYAGSSDDELEQGADQITISSDGIFKDLSLVHVSPSSEKESLDFADVSAACHLLELGNESNCGYSKENLSGLSKKRKCQFYDPSIDLERLSEHVEKVYAALLRLSSVSSSPGTFSNQEVGYWTIEVSKDSGWFRMKRIKRDDGLLGVPYSDDDTEVLERPPWKRQYKSLTNL